LQALFCKISDNFVRGATKYETLIDKVKNSDFDEVLILTVNYDLFLERAFKKSYGICLENLRSYSSIVLDDTLFKLFKLHGSANWGRRINVLAGEKDVLEVINSSKHGILQIANAYEIEVIDDNNKEENNYIYFPSIAVPIEGKTDFVLPRDFISEAVSFLDDCTNFLFIGFSANDPHVLKLFKNIKTVINLSFVNGSFESGLSAFNKISQSSSAFNAQFEMMREHGKYWACFSGGFKGFDDSGSLDAFLSKSSKY
jgi:hypothetical protein